MADKDPYDIASILHEMELDLIASQKRTLARHLAWEKTEGFEWEQWQNRKLESLRALKVEQGKIVREYGSQVNREIDALMLRAFSQRADQTELLFRDARRIISIPGQDDRNFFAINQPKLQALIDVAQKEHRAAESAALRLMEDEYRRTLYKAQVYYNTGSVSLGQALDLATAEFLASGIRSVQYRNGARVNIASYSEMAMRTANVRAQAIAQGAVMDDWGEHLVKVKRLGSTCDMCSPWQGRVMIDDVYAAGKPSEGEYPMLSSAIAAGLGHPNCRHIPVNPWFADVNTPERQPTAEENAEILKNYEAEEKQRYIERQTRKNKRLETGSVDPANVAKYGDKVKEQQGLMRQHLKDNPQLRRQYDREKLRVDPDANSPVWQTAQGELQAAQAKLQKMAPKPIPVPPKSSIINSENRGENTLGGEAAGLNSLRAGSAQGNADIQSTLRVHGRGADAGIDVANGGERYRKMSAEQTYTLSNSASGFEYNLDYSDYKNPSGKEFRESFNKAIQSSDHKASVEVHDEAFYDSTKNLIHKDGMSGVAIAPGGNIVSVYNASSRRGETDRLIPYALSNGGVKLDNYDGKLSDIYARYGFEPVSKTKFIDEFAPSGWNYERDGRPDIVFWKHNGENITQVMEKRVNNTFTTHDLSAVPEFGSYDEAEKYRDRLLA